MNEEAYDSDAALPLQSGTKCKTMPRAILNTMEVKAIVAASFGENGKRCYKVQWKESWVYDDHLFDCDSLVRQFWSKQVNVGLKRSHNDDSKFNRNQAIAVVQSSENEITHEVVKEINTYHSGNLKDTNEVFPSDDADSSHSGSKLRKKNTLQCHLCNNEFEMVSAIRRHYAEEHPGMKPFACESCGKRFDRRENLNRHIRIHTGDKKYVCEHCGKGYTDPSGLKKHCISKHASYKSELCNINLFKTNETLSKHIESHLQSSGSYPSPDEVSLFTKLHHKMELKPLDPSNSIQGVSNDNQDTKVIQTIDNQKDVQVQLLNGSSPVEVIRDIISQPLTIIPLV
ncbi:myoneurin isoform X1 [Hydra vulgaris]|uniref:myoneurin isoform X1 n=1 Tax=Hydra vulgaris TaxID=6087 RepID=UPI00064157AC